MSFVVLRRIATGALVIATAGMPSVVDAHAATDIPFAQPVSRERSTTTTVGMLAYSGDGPESRRTEVYRIRTDGSHRRQLTTHGGYNPAWSRDGTRIAYERNNWIWLMNASGGSKLKLVRGYAPAWAPDGRRLSYSCRDGIDLCVMDLETDVETVIVAATEEWPGSGSSTWSPDGAWIAFARNSAEGDDYTSDRQLFRVRGDGSELTAIPRTYPQATSPAWSPDGGTILYTDVYSGRGGEDSGDLWSIRPDGTGKRQVTRSAGSEEAASWSSDGQRIAMYRASYGMPYPNQTGVWTTNLDGTDREFVVRAYGAPSWRPTKTWAPTPAAEPARTSGQRIAYVAASDVGYDLFTVRPNGKSIQQITSTGRIFAPTWAPDHSRIAYGSHTECAIWVKNVRTGKKQCASKVVYPWEFSLAWSPSGHQLAWPNGSELTVYDLRTRKTTPIPLETDGYSSLYPTWSPDGRQIAFTEQSAEGNRDIAVVNARGGDVRRLMQLHGSEAHLNWSPNGQRILFSMRSGPYWAEKTSLLSVRADGSDVRHVQGTPGLDTQPAWSPDGRRVSYYSDGPAPYGKAPQPGIWTAGPGGESPHLVLRDKSIAYVDW